jgi:hypothetical protein
VLGLEPPTRAELGKPGDFSQCQSVRDIGRLLLRQVDVTDDQMTDDMIQQAIEANEAFIVRLKQIAERH